MYRFAIVGEIFGGIYKIKFSPIFSYDRQKNADLYCPFVTFGGTALDFHSTLSVNRLVETILERGVLKVRVSLPVDDFLLHCGPTLPSSSSVIRSLNDTGDITSQ